MALGGSGIGNASGDDTLLPREMGDVVVGPFRAGTDRKEDDGLAGTAARFQGIAEGALSQLLLSATVRAPAMPASCRP